MQDYTLYGIPHPAAKWTLFVCDKTETQGFC